MKKTLMLLAVLAMLSSAALAEDLQPPPWRGEISTTSQYWEFSEMQTNPIQPDGSPEGGQPWLPSTKLWVTPGPEMGWVSADEPFEYEPGKWVGYGVWELSGRIDVIVDNHDPKPENEKWIWVQVTWRPQDPGSGVEPVFLDLSPEPVNPPRLIEEILLGDLWRESTYAWELDWNPPDELFSIEGPINIDELVIDTWCVPEPATMSLLVLGACLPLLRRRR